MSWDDVFKKMEAERHACLARAKERADAVPLYVYCLVPIDFWYGWHAPDLYFHQSEEQDFFDALVEKAKQIAGHHPKFSRGEAWEGDVRTGPYVGPLPGSNDGQPFALAWKQENNGTTFLAAPAWLEYLRETMLWCITPDGRLHRNGDDLIMTGGRHG